ncbi:divergent polysaccharide deacetylase family protein [Pseudodesulfovibrio sp. zrk46]|uniref:divergent polysaccharide deacetylase family protein n=1 Tax=Pseudodesulfovibrio sp. zrk46 TaxID=2725288 RepID=UPI0014499F84|nr:divergent polysaccharide deacetylase family protein [Pseudodesulfovibrio sp. zrk46]QJB57691.1 divergent polysaccharide deacetylase family protein [Pseudodesulfovibrio sp. zrk46]
MDERSPEEITTEQKTGLDSLITRLYQPGPLVFLFILAFLAMASLGYYLLTKDTPPPTVVTETNTVSGVTSKPRIYEEELSDMEDKVKQADLAVIETMRAMEMNMQELGLLDVEMRHLEDKGYHYQVLQLPPVTEQQFFYKKLQTNLVQRLPEAVLSPVSAYEMQLSIEGIPTHRLLLKPTPLSLPRPKDKGPKLAIVIDDIGENLPVLEGLVNLDFQVTLAVWPHATHTRKSVEIIAQKRRDLIIHFPMEPKGYPRYNPGKDALFVSMTTQEIKQQVAENVSKIPEAIGVNNHMGSRFTGHTKGMEVALAEFKRHGLFFLDSKTTAKSVGRSTARETGIPFYQRDIFIDNVKDVNAIIHQLKKAENVALKRGHAIAIGHPYKETLAALKEWNNGRNQSINLIPLSRLTAE